MSNAQHLHDQTHTWDTATAKTWQASLPPQPPSAKVLSIPIHASRATMLIVDVFLERPGRPGGYKTFFVVEWAGQQTIPLRLSSFESIDAPPPRKLQDALVTDGGFPIAEASVLRLQARNATFAGTVLSIGPLSWLDEIPLIPINEHENLLEDFTATRFWDLSDWVMNDRCTLPPEDSGMMQVWFFAQPWYRERLGRFHRISFTKHCRRDISPFQAVTVSLSIDRRALFSLIFRIDGRDIAVIDRHRGNGDGEEIHILLSGNELQAITIEMEEAPETAGQSEGQTISVLVRWFLLERKGANLAQANEVRGMPDIAPPSQVDDLDECSLPVGILFSRDDLADLRQKVQSGRASRIYAEIYNEAASHLNYGPEQHVGHYVPIDYGNSQGAGRLSAHMQEMVHFNSAMVYNSLVYLLSGQLEHGIAARRALVATLRCDEWASGFVSRIPVGQPGYRAPFVTASTACAVALCYDMIYSLLSAQERRAVEDALYSKAIPWLDLYLRMFGEGYLLESNQGPVFSRGVIYAALVAQPSHPDVTPLLDKWIVWFQHMMTTCYEADGSTNEGPSYWEYTTHETVAALLAISRYVGKPVADITPSNVVNSMDYMLHMRSLSTPGLSFQNIGDCTSNVSKHMSAILLFFARHFKDRHALWLWNTYCADLSHPHGSPFFGTPLGPYVIDALLTLLLYEEGEPQPPQMPPSKRFEVCERVLWRTGANYGDTLLFFEGGRMIPGHAHFDKGQFLLEAFGERLIADPGMVNYADPSAEMYQSSICHNVITIHERNQSFKDLARAVVIDTLESNDQYSYLRADVSGSYRELDIFTRHLLFVRPAYFLLLDNVLSQEGGLHWRLHTAGDLVVNGQSVLINAPKAGILIHVAAACPLSTSTGAYYEGPTRLTSNLTLTPPRVTQSLWIAALLVPFPKPATAGVPSVECATIPGGVRYQVRGDWGEDTVTCRPVDVLQHDGPPTQDHIHIVRRQNGVDSLIFQIGV